MLLPSTGTPSRGAFSARSREVARAAERFRAQHGRAPERDEMRQLKLENRKAKIAITQADLQREWHQTASRGEFDGVQRRQAPQPPVVPNRAPLEDRVEARLTEHAATFEASVLRTVLLEQSVGELAPHAALARASSMIAERRVLPLEGGKMTTLTVRAQEQAIERRFTELSKPAGRDVGDLARELAAAQLAERIGGQLSAEQMTALEVLTGPERAGVLIGPAGTGKGVVIDAAARAEQLAGNRTFGIAVSGSTAQRLGRDSPALAGKTLTLDALVSRVEKGRVALDRQTTVYLDEAGMTDSDRFDRLAKVIEQTGSKILTIGDAAQLPSIGAGGMFDRLGEIAPSAELSNVRRTLDPGEQRAWADLRAGRSDRAMAYYARQKRLHLQDTRDQAIEHAVKEWATLTEQYPIEQVALISDASNVEIARLNARAQHYRAQRGELGEIEVEVPGVRYGIRQGDRVALIEQHHEPGIERFENGERGRVLTVDQDGQVLIEFDVTGRQARLSSEQLGRVRLAYASHIHRAQGATVTRTLVVTGGWQAAKEPAYVEASRARKGTDWFIAREDLGLDGEDSTRQQPHEVTARTPLRVAYRASRLLGSRDRPRRVPQASSTGGHRLRKRIGATACA